MSVSHVPATVTSTVFSTALCPATRSSSVRPHPGDPGAIHHVHNQWSRLSDGIQWACLTVKLHWRYLWVFPWTVWERMGGISNTTIVPSWPPNVGN